MYSLLWMNWMCSRFCKLKMPEYVDIYYHSSISDNITHKFNTKTHLLFSFVFFIAAGTET